MTGGRRISELMKWVDRNCSNAAAARAQYYYPYRIPPNSKSKNTASVSSSSSSRRTPSFWLNLCGRCFCTSTTDPEPPVTDRSRCFYSGVSENTRTRISLLKEKLVQCSSDPEAIAERLDENADILFDGHEYRCAFVRLLIQLRAKPEVAVVAFDWRRRKASAGFPLAEVEYVQGIVLAGRIKSVDQAKKLFDEAASRNMRSPAIYNALMGAYMVNGRVEKVQELFETFGAGDARCRPTTVTYNILITMFGHLMLVDRMEAVFRAVRWPDVDTYNCLIAGYLAAWMWDRMEVTYASMGAAGVCPDSRTHLLMVRAYGQSDRVDEMEEMYRRVSRGDNAIIPLMVCAHWRSSRHDRLEKIAALVSRLRDGTNVLPHWLVVVLIGVYAKQGMVVEMEGLVDEAIRTGVTITSVGTLRAVITCYFRRREADRLSRFVSRLEAAGWPVHPSLYHCKMVMFSLLDRVDEVKGVLAEMRRAQLVPTKRTYWILLKAYSTVGLSRQVSGLMFKSGYGLPIV